ncbi:MAG: HAD family hydrolase [Sulfitobacter sp.]
MRIAMWSGPRNLSTAMMYSFGNRADFSVIDEPFYGAYLSATGVVHPMQDQILEAHQTNPDMIDASCRSGGSPHLYMKQMPHHMIDGFPLGWADGCVHVHLIRHPARVIASYTAKREEISLADIGFEQQTLLYNAVGGLVVDSADIRANPEMMLRRLCDAIDLPFDPAMLSWPAGPKLEDGIWAKHWYGAVHKSTGFAGAEPGLPKLEPHLQPLLSAALPHYEAMAACKI